MGRKCCEFQNQKRKQTIIKAIYAQYEDKVFYLPTFSTEPARGQRSSAGDIPYAMGEKKKA